MQWLQYPRQEVSIIRREEHCVPEAGMQCSSRLAHRVLKEASLTALGATGVRLRSPVLFAFRRESQKTLAAQGASSGTLRR